MKKKSAPPPPPAAPDPRELIAAQARALPSVRTPFGQSVYSGDPSAGTFEQNVTLSPEEQRKYEAYSGIAQAQLDRSGRALGGMDESFEFRGAEDPTTNRYFTEQQKMLDRVYGRQEEDLEQSLANKGLPMGSEAYGEEMGDFRRGRAEDYERAAAGSLQAGFGQALTSRQQQLAEIAQAMGTGAPQIPQAGGSGPLDPMLAQQLQQQGLNQQYQGALQTHQADVASSNAGLSSAAMIAAVIV